DGRIARRGTRAVSRAPIHSAESKTVVDARCRAVRRGGAGCRGRDFQITEKERTTMKQVTLTLPEIGLIAGTRAALGAGVALLLGDKLTPEQRRAAGWALFL